MSTASARRPSSTGTIGVTATGASGATGAADARADATVVASSRDGDPWAGASRSRSVGREGCRGGAAAASFAGTGSVACRRGARVALARDVATLAGVFGSVGAFVERGLEASACGAAGIFSAVDACTTVGFTGMTGTGAGSASVSGVLTFGTGCVATSAAVALRRRRGAIGSTAGGVSGAGFDLAAFFIGGVTSAEGVGGLRRAISLRTPSVQRPLV